MVTKSLKLDESTVEKIELAASSLNKKTGAEVFDFSNVVRIALNQYLESTQVKEMIASYEVKRNGDKGEMLNAGQSSLAKDWLKPEENEAWADL